MATIKYIYKKKQQEISQNSDKVQILIRFDVNVLPGSFNGLSESKRVF